MGIILDFINLFFPSLCVCCQNRLVMGEQHICLSCINKLPKTDYHLQPDNKLEQFLAGRFPFVRIASFTYFVKDGTIQALIHELKYRKNAKIGHYIGQLCGTHIEKSPFIENIDIIIPIPLHPKRLKQRGYNQAQLLAEGISSIVSKPVSCDNLIRKINNQSQTTQNKYQRWKNTDGIFDIINPSDFENKHVLLIDDVLTTGSTTESCVKTLLSKCDNTHVSIFTVGSTI